MAKINDDYSYLTGSDNSYIDSLYETYKTKPDELDSTWVYFFKGLEYKDGQEGGGNLSYEDLKKEFNAFRIVQSYRARGHLLSDTNPIRPRRDRLARLDVTDYGLEVEDLDKVYSCSRFFGLGDVTLRETLEHMKKIYCKKIGIEYMHSNNTEIRRWVREKFEKEALNFNFSIDKKKHILHKLNQAEVFENFLQTKFIGQKRFSLEGGETTIPALDAIINRGADLGIKEFVFGMAHRGRLNVLANIIGKSYEFIFKEFEGGTAEEQHTGGGDVKYHQGFSSVSKSLSGKDVFLKIMHNPSHLEAVAPVALGYSRAQADIRYGQDTGQVLPIMVHGDAALAGQGVCYETLQMAQLPAYQCGGAIHFVINNQIGFTTDWHDGRSSTYCTSLARTLEAPIIHVNGDDPEAVVYAVEFAVEFRAQFKTDIFIDMVCYRKHGHNEGDEPKYTQPHLYGLISKAKNPRALYMQALLDNKSITAEDAKNIQDDFKQMLSDRFNNVKDQNLPTRVKGPHTEWLDLRWSKPADFDKSPNTGVDKKVLDQIIEKLTNAPEGFNVLKKAQKMLEERKAAYDNNQLDWALGELLAFGSMLTEGANVRFTGQDVVRGTFSHRHSKLFDEKTNEAYCGLANLREKQGMLEIFNSHLSEYAVLGFEYGYSLASPKSLNIWEAQFGDFSNTAQVIIDQFISSCESKWERMSSIVMLLPHGYEGQGPEHSSARAERYLQLTAEYNMAVCNITNPANLFHALRRQTAWEFRKPLIVFTPKSLLRDPRCTSQIEDFTKGRFCEMYDDDKVDAKKVKRVLFCTGKVYYDLRDKRDADKRNDVAVVRLEQIFPFPEKQFEKILEKYPEAQWYWVQEEPMNMGYWEHLLARHTDIFKNFTLVARHMSSTPATGFGARHKKEQEQIINESFAK